METLKKARRKVYKSAFVAVIVFGILGLIFGTYFLHDILAKNKALNSQAATTYSEMETQLAKSTYARVQGAGLYDSGLFMGSGDGNGSSDRDLLYTFLSDEKVLFLLLPAKEDRSKVITEEEVALIIENADEDYEVSSIRYSMADIFKEWGWTEEEIEATTSTFISHIYYIREPQIDATSIVFAIIGYGIFLILLIWFVLTYFISGKVEYIKKYKELDNLGKLPSLLLDIERPQLELPNYLLSSHYLINKNARHSKDIIIERNEIEWIYKRHRVNRNTSIFASDQHIYSVNLSGLFGFIEIVCGDAEATQLLQMLKEQESYLVIGYHDEWQVKYQRGMGRRNFFEQINAIK